MPGAESAFDAHARRYDELFTFTDTGFRQRLRVWDHLKQLDPAQHRNVLEINCGTGEDALWLAKRGHKVIATDLSQGMIDAAKRKAETERVKIDFRKAAFDELAEQFSPRSFDLIFSNFGGLNCVDEQALRSLSKTVASLLRPGGRFIAVIMGDNCGWEKFYFRMKGDKQKAARRSGAAGTTAEIDGERFHIWYYSPQAIEEIFSAQLAHKATRAIGWALPPSYLDPRFRSRKMLLGLLAGIDKTFSGFRFAAARADHFLADFEKKTDNFRSDR